MSAKYQTHFQVKRSGLLGPDISKHSTGHKVKVHTRRDFIISMRMHLDISNPPLERNRRTQHTLWYNYIHPLMFQLLKFLQGFGPYSESKLTLTLSYWVNPIIIRYNCLTVKTVLNLSVKLYSGYKVSVEWTQESWESVRLGGGYFELSSIK
jgi:hypothetical protein